MEQTSIVIRRATLDDTPAVCALALALWPDNEPCALEAELRDIIASAESCVALCEDAGTREALGFAQCQLRHDYVEGTSSSPVGYLEGIFVAKGRRYAGIAREMLEFCQSWAKRMGCVEFASDCELDNTASLAFHKATGFTEANRIICFTKRL